MKNRDVFVMAWRWLMLHRARTILTVIGLTISTFSLFLVLSYVSYAKGMYFSYADERRNDFILSVPVCHENEKGELISLNSGIIEEIKKIEDVVAVRSIYSVPSAIRSVENERIDLAAEVGVIASWDRFFLPLEENLVLTGERSFTGRIFFENDINKVIIEKSMYKTLQLKANKAEVETACADGFCPTIADK